MGHLRPVLPISPLQAGDADAELGRFCHSSVRAERDCLRRLTEERECGVDFKKTGKQLTLLIFLLALLKIVLSGDQSKFFHDISNAEVGRA